MSPAISTPADEGSVSLSRNLLRVLPFAPGIGAALGWDEYSMIISSNMNLMKP